MTIFLSEFLAYFELASVPQSLNKITVKSTGICGISDNVHYSLYYLFKWFSISNSYNYINYVVLVDIVKLREIVNPLNSSE